MNIKDRLIREKFDQLVLREFEGGDAGGGGWGGSSSGGYFGMGGRVTDDTKLFNTFIKPFTNVAKTAFSGAQAIAKSAQTVVTVIAKAIMEKIIPTYTANYEKTFKSHDETMNKINKEYEPVYRDIVNSMKKNPDFLISAFMFDPGSFFGVSLHNPQTFLSLWGGAQAPKLFSKLLSSLSGGAVDPYLEKIKNAVTDNKLSSSKKEGVFFDGKLIIEADEKQVKQVIGYLTSPELLKIALNSETAKKMSAKTRNATQLTLDKILDIVAKTTKLTDIEQVQNITGE